MITGCPSVMIAGRIVCLNRIRGNYCDEYEIRSGLTDDDIKKMHNFQMSCKHAVLLTVSGVYCDHKEATLLRKLGDL